MTTLVRYLVSSLDDSRLPAFEALAASRLVLTLGAERIDREEFTALLSMDRQSHEIWLASAEWDQPFAFKAFGDIGSAWGAYSDEWTSDCIIATSRIAIIQPGSDSYFMVVCTQDIIGANERAFAALNARFQEWSTDETQSRHFIATMSALREKYARLIA